MKRKGKFIKAVKITLSSVLLTTAVFCVLGRLPECFSENPAALAAAAFTLTDGTYRLSSVESEPETQSVTAAPIATSPQNDKPVRPVITQEVKKDKDKTGYYDSYGNHEGEIKYSVNEHTYLPDGTRVGNGYIKNKTGLDFDFDERLNAPLTFDVEKNLDSPQVLIYHTHTSEGYLDESVDYYYESYYSRTQNNDYNVVAVGEALAEELEAKGIKALHDVTVHDSTYNGSYDRSVMTVESDIAENNNIDVVLDIHRDAIGTDENKGKLTFEYNGKKGAQIMILSGCDYYGERGFDGWRNNLSFALKLEDAAERMFPGMTRPVSFDFFAYNEYVCDGSLLIEIGTDANSIEEAEYSARLLAEVLAEVLIKE